MRRYFDDACEDSRKHNHRQQWLNDGPADPGKALFVANLDIPHRKDQDDVPVPPDFPQFQCWKSGRWFDADGMALVNGALAV